MIIVNGNVQNPITILNDKQIHLQNNGSNLIEYNVYGDIDRG